MKKLFKKKKNRALVKELIISLIPALIILVIGCITFVRVPKMLAEGYISRVHTIVFFIILFTICLGTSIVFIVECIKNKKLKIVGKVVVTSSFVICMIISFLNITEGFKFLNIFTSVSNHFTNKSLCKNESIVKNCEKAKEGIAYCFINPDDENASKMLITCDQDVLSESQYSEQK